MGIDLEKMLWKMYSPHKVKLAVSGCPRNCAESGIKDVGVIGVDAGWELHVAGNGGIKTEVAQFLCKVATREAVLEYTGAFLQLYREEARYLDREPYGSDQHLAQRLRRHRHSAPGRAGPAHQRGLYPQLSGADRGRYRLPAALSQTHTLQENIMLEMTRVLRLLGTLPASISMAAEVPPGPQSAETLLEAVTGSQGVGFACFQDQPDTGQNTGFKNHSNAIADLRRNGAVPLSGEWTALYTGEVAQQRPHANAIPQKLWVTMIHNS